MKQIAVFISLVLLAIGGVTAASAQDAAGTPAATEGDVRVVSIAGDAPTPSKFGFVQTTIAPGGSYSFAAGSAPAVLYVAKGTVTVEGDDLMVEPSDSAIPGTAVAGSTTLDAGTLFVVPAGGSIELRNGGVEPVSVLDLLIASDATNTNDVDVTHLVLAQQDYELLAGSVTITLSKMTLEPGEQFDWPAEPAITTLNPLDRADAFLLTGQGFNKGKDSIEIYVLTIEPD